MDFLLCISTEHLNVFIIYSQSKRKMYSCGCWVLMESDIHVGVPHIISTKHACALCSILFTLFEQVSGEQCNTQSYPHHCDDAPDLLQLLSHFGAQ